MLNAEKFRDEIFDNDNNLICDKLRDVFFRETKENQFKSLGKVVRWLLSEYKKPILDEVERGYLSAVCRPYKVVTISKRTMFSNENQWIEICADDIYLNGYVFIHLPYFNANTMYKGMELGKEYTPQELGIKCRNNPNGKIKHD